MVTRTFEATSASLKRRQENERRTARKKRIDAARTGPPDLRSRQPARRSQVPAQQSASQAQPSSSAAPSQVSGRNTGAGLLRRMEEGETLRQQDFDGADLPGLSVSGPSGNGEASPQTLQQDIDATRGRTEIKPASDPGGGAGRIRPSRPILSRRELEEQRRRASHDASSAQAGLRRAAGSISGRGPTANQRKTLSSGPTAGDFLAGRVAAITAAAQPDPAQDRAQELGLRRLESDRSFATDSRDQNIDLRGQDVDERLGLRREETFRRGQDKRLEAEQASSSRNSSGGQGDGNTVLPFKENEDGERVLDLETLRNATPDQRRAISSNLGSTVGANLRASGMEISNEDAGALATSFLTETGDDPTSRALQPRSVADVERLVTVAQFLPSLGEGVPQATNAGQLGNQLVEMAATEGNAFFGLGGRTARVGGEKVSFSEASGPAASMLIQTREMAKDAARASFESDPSNAQRALENITDAELGQAESAARERISERVSSESGGLRRSFGEALGSGDASVLEELKQDPQVSALREAKAAIQEGKIDEYEAITQQLESGEEFSSRADEIVRGN